MENEIVIKENKIVRIYSVEEYEKYFSGKKCVNEKELININSHIFPTIVWDNLKNIKKLKAKKNLK